MWEARYARRRLIFAMIAARSAPQKIAWSDRVIPLSKEIVVAKSAVHRADEILFEAWEAADSKIATAATLIRHFALARQSGKFIVRMALTSKPGCSIPAGIIERLANVPNKDQAYAIVPLFSYKGVAAERKICGGRIGLRKTQERT